MRKFTLFLASLFLTIGAMAQTLADGVYTIQADENGKRGYLAVNADYDRPVLTEISWDSHAANSAEAMENGKYWSLWQTGFTSRKCIHRKTESKSYSGENYR